MTGILHLTLRLSVSLSVPIPCV